MRMAGRFSRRVRGFAKANGIPVIDCNSEDKKHQIAEERLRNNPTVRGLFLILVSRAVATVWEVKRSHRGVIQNLVAKWPYINYYSYDVLSTTTWFSSLVKTKKLLGFWFPSEPPVAITSTCRTAHRRQGRGGVCRGVANPSMRRSTLSTQIGFLLLCLSSPSLSWWNVFRAAAALSRTRGYVAERILDRAAAAPIIAAESEGEES
jgi:hypothetical protein